MNKIAKKALLFLIIFLMIFGINSTSAEAKVGGCGGKWSCGCSSRPDSQAYKADSCRVGVDCWYDTVGYGGCDGHNWYKTLNKLRYF